jgi:hypothetical protein
MPTSSWASKSISFHHSSMSARNDSRCPATNQPEAGWPHSRPLALYFLDLLNVSMSLPEIALMRIIACAGRRRIASFERPSLRSCALDPAPKGEPYETVRTK